MALVDNAWYVNFGDGSTTGYYAVAQWTALTPYVAGAIVRQLATPAVNSERCFICVVAGTSLVAEPTWTLTRGATTAEAAGPTWQECTGIAAINGDATNTPSWTITATPPGGVKNTAVTKGQVIKRDNGASYQICTTAGNAGNGAEPGFSDTAGTTTADNTVTWTSLGVVGNFTGWQAPHARLANSFASTWGQAGNIFYVRSNHAETQASALTLSSPSTSVANMIKVVCVDVNDTALPPTTVMTVPSASITTTGAFNISLQVGAISGGGSFEGFIFSAGTGATNAAVILGLNRLYMKNCALRKLGTTANVGAIQLGDTYGMLDNVTVKFGATGDRLYLSAGSYHVWKNTPNAIEAGSAAITGMVNDSSSDNIEVIGVDFSSVAGMTIFTAYHGSIARFVDCKFNASVTNNPALTGYLFTMVDFIRCDSGGTNYFDARATESGNQDQETSIVRTGGATDGTTLISWKISTIANARWAMPFNSQPITIWNDSTSAITTLTFYGTTTGGGVPKDDDIWVEVEYLGSGASPLGSIVTTTKASAIAASAATNNSADGSTWGGAGAGNGFKIVVPSFTPGMAGPINITVKAGKTSATYYIDPKPSISGVTVSKSAILAPGVYANELSGGAAGGGLRLAGSGGLASGS